jgi:hypothetical protein
VKIIIYLKNGYSWSWSVEAKTIDAILRFAKGGKFLHELARFYWLLIDKPFCPVPFPPKIFGVKMRKILF